MRHHLPLSRQSFSKFFDPCTEWLSVMVITCADAGVLEHHQGALPGGLPLQARLRRFAGAPPLLLT